MSGPEGSELYRRAVAAAITGGFYAFESNGTPVAIGPDSVGPRRVPLRLRREDAEKHACESGEARLAKPRLIKSRALFDRLLPQLVQTATPLVIIGSASEFVDPARLLEDLARYMKPRPASRRDQARPVHGVGQQMLDAFVANRLGPALKARGFSGSGLRWFLRGNGVWGVIWIQKNRWNRSDVCEFTVNLDVASDRLRYFEGEADWTKRPSGGALSGVHERLGFLLPQRQDTWWQFSLACDPDAVERELESAVLGPGLAFLRQLRSDEALRDHWLSRRSEHYGVQEINLAVLLHDLGPRDLLPALIDSIRAEAHRRRWDYAEVLLRRITDQDRSAFNPPAESP